MNRRDLLKSLTALPALAPLIRLEESPTKPRSDASYEDWEIRWYGWSKPVNQHVLIGYWYAVNEKRKLMAYSACPGNVLYILELQLMNTSIQEDQVVITPDTPVAIAENEQRKALDKLLHFLKTEEPPEYITGIKTRTASRFSQLPR